MNKIERRRFIGSAAMISGALSLGAKSFSSGRPDPEQEKALLLKGRENTLVNHWDVITIGNLSRNRYWGESDEKALHSAICTCTVISGKNFHVLVDPSLSDEQVMRSELKRRTGLSPEDIDAVFITHQHDDHTAGLTHFPGARWMAGAEVADGLNKSDRFPKKIESAGMTLFGALEVIPTPGHTPDHYGLRFDYRNLSVVIAGDSVATRDFWDDRRMYYNVLDIEESKKTLQKLNSLADIIVPGHDNYFFNI